MIARRGGIKYLKYYRHAGDERQDIIITRYTVRNLIVAVCLACEQALYLGELARRLRYVWNG